MSMTTAKGPVMTMSGAKVEASSVIAHLWARVQAVAKESGSSTADVLKGEQQELKDQPLDERGCLDPVEVELLVNGMVDEDKPEVKAALAHLEACQPCLELVCLAIPSEKELSQFMTRLKDHETHSPARDESQSGVAALSARPAAGRTASAGR